MPRLGQKKSEIDRFEALYIGEPMSGCWLWLAAIDGPGYPYFKDATSKMRRAHRWSYEHFVGPIPLGLELDHLCRVRCCVNPAHLEPVTGTENKHRSPLHKSNATQCKHGHPFDQQNTSVRDRGNGTSRRVCLACDRERKRDAASCP